MNLKPFLVIALLIMYGSSPAIVLAQENAQQPSWSWVNPEGGSDVGYQTKQSSAAAMQVSCVVCPELTVERLKAVSLETVTYEYSSEPVDPVPSGDWLYPLMGLSHALPLPDFSTLFSTGEAQEANHEAIHYDAFEGSCGDNFIDATGPWQPIDSNADGHQGSYWAGAPLSFFAQYFTLSEGETLAGIEEHYQLKRGFWQALVPTVGCAGIGSFDGEIAFLRVRALVCVEPYSEVFEGRCILPEKATVTGPNDTGCDETEANPCNPATGDKVDSQTDISFSGLSFTRFYSSLRGASDTGLGENWSHNYYKRLIGGNTDSEPVSLQFGAGKQFALEFVGHEAINVGVNELGDPLQLFVAVYGSSNHPHYQVAVSRVPGIESRFLRYADATIEIYDAQGKLTQIDNKGHKTNLSYNRRAQLTTVADQYGHSLTFQYNANGNISNVTTSNGEAFAYAYDSSDNLVQVVFPQLNGATESKTYHYENASLPNHLTGISDENGDRYSSYEYDLNGLVISSEHATTSNHQAQHHYAFDYDGAETTVTDPAGTDVKWLFAKNKGYNNVLEKQYVADDKGLVQLFDAQNNLLTRTDAEGRVTTYVYNANRQRIRIVEATGTLEERTTDIEYFSPDIDLITEVTSPSVYGGESKTLTLNYNDQFNVIAQSVSGFKKSGAAVTRTTQFEYNDRGQLTAIDGPRTDVQDLTQFEYRDCIGGAGCGDLLSITNAIGHVVSFDQYDANGRVTMMTDANGLVSTYQYHPRGWVLSVTQTPPSDDARIVRYHYDGIGQLSKIEMPDGSELSYSYDAAHELRQVTDNLGNRVEYAYDVKGNLVSEAVYGADNSLVKDAALAYDIRDFVESINTSGSITSLVTDAVGNVSRTTDPKQNPDTSHSFDNLNRLTQTIDALTNTTAYQYNVADQLTKVTSPNGSVTQYEYDDLGNQTKEISADRGTTTYTYDAAGNVTSMTDARGITLTYQYDALNRLTQLDSPTARHRAHYKYDAGNSNYCTNNSVGRVCRVRDSSGREFLDYDAWGNIVRVRRSVQGFDGLLVGAYITDYSYDAANRVSSIQYPSGRSVSFTRDAVGRLTGVDTQDADGNTDTIVSNRVYRADGLWTSQSYDNGLTQTKQYDKQGRLISHLADDYSRDYIYDANGNIISADAIDNSQERDYGYDVLDRLTSESDSIRNLIRDYQYDANGNREQFSEAAQFSSLTYQADTNRLTAVNSAAITLDTSGRTLSDASGRSFTYDDLGRLEQVELGGQVVGQYLYDHQQLRTQKLTSDGLTVYHYDLSGNVIAESDRNGTVLIEYIYADGERVAALLPGSTPSSTASNLALGKVAVLSDTINGAVASRTVDGNTDGNYSGASLSMTSNSVQPWWQVDLNVDSAIDSITVHNRTDAAADRLADFYVFISDAPFGQQTLDQLIANPNVTRFYHGGTLASSSLTFDTKATEGRHVRLQLSGSNYLHFAEMEVTGVVTGNTPDLINIAKEKYAEQVSVYSGGVASRAVDGNTDPSYISDSVVFTIGEAQPWWQVDLGKQAELDTVRVYQRIESNTSYSQSLADFYVMLSPTPFGTRTLSQLLADTTIERHYHAGNFLGSSLDIAVSNTPGRYVRVQLTATDRLELAEVEVLQDASLVEQVPAESGIHYYVNDHLMTPKMAVNQSNEVTWQADYTAFGKADVTVERFVNNHRFPGQYFDKETGLYYNWNRYYDPNTGRYVTSDPIGLGGGLNTYGYAYQNPLYWTDPQGLNSLVIEGVISAPKPIPLPAWAGPAGAIASAGLGGYWFGGKLYPYIAQPLGSAIDYICLSDTVDPDKPYAGQTPDDKPEDFRRGKRGDKINNDDGSIWSPERAGDRSHGGSKWKRWPSERDRGRSRGRESVRPDGSLR